MDRIAFMHIRNVKIMDDGSFEERAHLSSCGSLDMYEVVKALVSGVGATMKANKVTVITATAVIKGRSANGFAVEADGQTYEGKRLVMNFIRQIAVTARR